MYPPWLAAVLESNIQKERIVPLKGYTYYSSPAAFQSVQRMPLETCRNPIADRMY
jgi:hypothetical protein